MKSVSCQAAAATGRISPDRVDISQITEQLYIAAYPQDIDASMIRDLGVSLVIHMIHGHPAHAYRQLPFRLLVLSVRDSPFIPIPIPALMSAAEEGARAIRAGEKVLVYCREGRHRSVAAACSILIGLGQSAEEAMRLVKEKRPKADPYMWYIKRRILKFEQDWKHKAVAGTY